MQSFQHYSVFLIDLKIKVYKCTNVNVLLQDIGKLNPISTEGCFLWIVLHCGVLLGYFESCWMGLCCDSAVYSAFPGNLSQTSSLFRAVCVWVYTVYSIFTQVSRNVILVAIQDTCQNPNVICRSQQQSIFHHQDRTISVLLTSPGVLLSKWSCYPSHNEALAQLSQNWQKQFGTQFALEEQITLRVHCS